MFCCLFTLYSRPQTGHYTQLVWAEIEWLGCARAVWEKSGWTHIYLVCNYGGKKTGGNLVGSPMYLVGEPCSKCSDACSEKRPGLCGESKTVNAGKIVLYRKFVTN